MSKLTLERAKELLPRHTTEDHLFVHAACVSAAMGAMADYFGEDRDHWEAIGWLHDVDYEQYPSTEEHCHHVRSSRSRRASTRPTSAASSPTATA